MRCVSYTRTTTCLRGEAAEENVISQQNRIIRDYMKERGWKLDAKYSDRKNNDQEETAFQKMRLDGIARKFDMVVISSAFRCGRSVSFAEDLLLKTFYPAGIHFAVAEDGFCSMEHSQQEAEEYLCAKRRESNVSCMRHAERAKERQGLFDVHDEKYGYLLKDDFSGFVIDEEVVPVIREIFQFLADNMTMQAVADLLNERGVESPAVHLERVGRKNFHANGRKWALGSVQRILQNTAYIGYWTKMVGGKPQTVDIPAIVEKEIFERATENVTSRGRKMPEDVIRSENAFVKQIFDKETGQPLVCRRYTDDGDYQMFHKNWFAVTQGISYKAVEEAVVSAVYAEKELAEKIASLICSDKAAKELDGRVEILSEEAKQIFSQRAEYKRDTLRAYQAFRDGNLTEPELQVVSQQTTDKLSVLDQQFDEVMEAVNKVKTAYSMKNPWLSHYRKVELHGEVTKKDVRKWVDRIVVENLHYIDVELIRQEWKSFFPAEWMEGGSADGKKKQT